MPGDVGEGYAVWWRWVVDCGRWYWGRVDEEVVDLSDDVPLQTPYVLAAGWPSVWCLWVYSIVEGPPSVSVDPGARLS